ncbi:MAG: diacylglycerol kinase [Deltaproteobacteria bacterium]|nr:diacylglycerol kinase [Deltaproteobacteria bacterium]
MGTNRNDRENKRKGLKRLFYALVYSLEGLTATFRSEAAFRQEVLVMFISTTAAVILPLSFVFKAVLIASTFVVLLAELVNTALEEIADVLFRDLHPSAKLIKDAGSAAVLLSIVSLITAWIFALFQLIGEPR